jgi:hypothetical protein
MPAQKYRGKPVIIEAIQLTESNRGEVAKWVGEADVINKSWDTKNLYIKNEHGEVIAEPTDWIIKGSRGEFYPCKDSTFKEKYEKAMP